MNIKQFRRNFFDASKVLDKADAAHRHGKMRFGATVRIKAKRSIRKRKTSSTPGNAPSGHVGHLRRFLFFANDATNDSVVIGPAAMKESPSDDIVNRQLPTETLEYGGTIGVSEVLYAGRWTRMGLLSKSKRQGLRKRVRWVHVKQRQYMGPAFESELPNANQYWANSIRG